MPTTQEFIASFFGDTLKMPDAVASLLNEDGTFKDDAVKSVLTFDASRIKALKEADGKTFDNGYKKAQSEIAKRKDKQIRELHGIEEPLEGDELIEAVKAKQAEDRPTGTKLSDEEVKAHPVFRAREKELLKLNSETNAKHAAEIEKIAKEGTRKETLSKVLDRAAALAKDAALLPADEAKARAQLKRLVLDPLNDYEYSIGDDGEITVMDKEGKRLEDAHRNPVTFEYFVLKTADENGLTFKTAEEKKAPNGDGKNGKEGKAPVKVPTNQQEYAAYLTNPDIPLEDKNKMKEAWSQKQTA